MNDLKFKVYVKPENTKQNYHGLYDVQGIDFINKQVLIARSSVFEEHLFNFSDVEFLGFCGKVDKDNQQIFEDDIIEDDGGNRGLVEWNDDHAQFLVRFSDETQELFEVESWGKVIGNKCLNSELLEMG